MNQCKNCNEPIHQKYCPNCGQKTSVGRISLPQLIKDLPHAVFHVDRGFLFNLNQFFRRPGPAILDYFAGKRKAFFHPASFLVIALILNYLVVVVTDLHFYDTKELQGMDPEKAKVITDYDAQQWWFLEHTYLYILLAIPVSTLFLFAVLKLMKQKYNIAETAVIVLFTIAQGVMIQTIIYGSLGWVNSGPFIRTVELVNICILVTYASWVVYQLMASVRNQFSRIAFACIGGIGLAVSWMASAYVLYFMMN